MKKLGILFATITMAMLFVISANAKEIAPAGQCGDNVYWSYNETTGELKINGNGYMWNYNYGSSSFSYSDIKNVIIEYGVTSIGNSTFSSCQYLTSITIPDSVKTIGASAFNGCY